MFDGSLKESNEHLNLRPNREIVNKHIQIVLRSPPGRRFILPRLQGQLTNSLPLSLNTLLSFNSRL